MFGEERVVSRHDVTDQLIAHGVYEDSDFAYEFVDDIWSMLMHRARRIGREYAMEVTSHRVTSEFEWQDRPGLSFCLAISLANWCELTNRPAVNAVRQGEIFEQISALALQCLLPNWEVVRVGWSPAAPVTIADVVKRVSDLLGERSVLDDVEYWSTRHARDEGLDIVAANLFGDVRPSNAVWFTQCASGSNWDTKLDEPSINLWSGLIQFSNTPKKALIIPYELDGESLRRSSRKGDCIILDRGRLLRPGDVRLDWVTQEIREQIVEWVDPIATELRQAI